MEDRAPYTTTPKEITLIAPFQGYDVTIGGKTFSNFRQTDEWNGLIEMKDPHGRTLIVD